MPNYLLFLLLLLRLHLLDFILRQPCRRNKIHVQWRHSQKVQWHLRNQASRSTALLQAVVLEKFSWEVGAVQIKRFEIHAPDGHFCDGAAEGRCVGGVFVDVGYYRGVDVAFSADGGVVVVFVAEKGGYVVLEGRDLGLGLGFGAVLDDVGHKKDQSN